MTDERSTTHVAGLDVLWDGRWLRQRCAWCGTLLLDYDLDRVAVAEPDDTGPSGPATYEVGVLVRVTGDGPTTSAAVLDREPTDDDYDDVFRAPDDACMGLDPEVTA